MTVQENIDIFRQSLWRNVLQAEFQFIARKIDNQRPIKTAVAVSTHNRDLRTDRAELIQNAFRANISKMPDFVRALRELFHLCRQTIMRVRQNKNAEFCHRERRARNREWLIEASGTG